jgi:hypothetical protein
MEKWAWIDATILTVTDACIEWPWGKTKGYGTVRLGYVNVGVHAHICEAVNGPRPRDTFACHTCDNRSCCNPTHLYWGTPNDNVADRMRARGQRKLTDADIAAIRAAHVGIQHKFRRTGPSTYDLAEQYGVSQRRIMRIINQPNQQPQGDRNA